MRNKRSARQFAFQFLYHLGLPEFKEQLADYTQELKNGERESLREKIYEFAGSTELPGQDDIRNFAIELIEKVIEHVGEIEALISEKSHHWKIERMSKVDLTLLKLGLAELRYCTQTPPKVVLNECIELAKIYGSAQSSKFINGLLDRLIQEGDHA